MKKLNLPNKLTVFRFCMVPVFILVMYFIPDDFADGGFLWIIRNAVGALIFLAASVTDAVDGHIARKRNLVTDFGKFLDPLADKFIVISAMTMIFYLNFYSNIRRFFVWVFIVVLLREFAVTGLRLVLCRNGEVMAAGKLGKIKTSFQMTFVMTTLLEPILYRIIGIFVTVPDVILTYPPLTLLSMAGTLLFTVWSGIDYFRGTGKYIDPEK